jgi:hypothetical protein
MTHINKLTTISGTTTTEQGLVTVLDNFLCNIVGWERTYKYTDTGTARHFGFTSLGEYSDGERMQLYTSFNATSDYIYTYAYTWAAGEPESGVGSTDTIGGDTWRRIPLGPGAVDFWIMSNRDVVYIMFRRNDNNDRYLAGAGYLKSPYTFKEDPLPAFALGQNSSTATFLNTFRVAAYGASSHYIGHTEGAGGGPFMDPSTTVSGFAADYVGIGNTLLNTYYGPNQESTFNGRLLASPITLWRRYTDSLFTCESIRGQLPNIWHIYGDATRQIGGYITGSGINVFTEEVVEGEIFIIMDGENQIDNTQIIGPIINFDILDHSKPYSVGDGGRFQLWLSSYYYSMRHNNNYFDYNGHVSNWRSQQYHPADTAAEASVRNDASQATLANQPRTVQNVAAFNNNAVVRFASSDNSNLTSSLTASNDITIFAVASYSNGANRTPIINIRGDVSATDTLFSLEFNENNSNSATAIMAAGGGTDREEVGSLDVDTPYILTATVSGNDTTLYVNGWSGSSSTITNTKSNVAGGTYTLNYAVGVDKVSGGANGTVFSDADVAELMVYRQALTEEEKQSIVCMLGSRYNITVSGTC